MNQADIEQVFRTLQLETEEQRNAMRFEPFSFEEHPPVFVVTTGSTCQVSVPEEQDVA